MSDPITPKEQEAQDILNGDLKMSGEAGPVAGEYAQPRNEIGDIVAEINTSERTPTSESKPKFSGDINEWSKQQAEIARAKALATQRGGVTNKPTETPAARLARISRQGA